MHLRSLAGALAALGHQVVLLTSREPAKTGGWPFVWRQLDGAQSLLDAGRELGPPDLIYERYSLGHEEGLRAARTLGSPFALEVNSPLALETRWHRPHLLRPGHWSAERRLLEQADLVLAVSTPLRAYLTRRRGTSEGVVVLRNGCAPGLHPSAATRGSPAAEPTIAFLGHPKPWHGAQLLPEVLLSLEKQGVATRLLVIGGGPGAEEIRQAASSRGLEARLEITGPLAQEEAARRLREALVSVAPYPPQPFFYFCPLKVIESMMAGVPVLTTTQGDLPEIVGEGGITVPAGNLGAFADALYRLLTDPGLRHQLGGQARHRALSHFTWEATARKLLHEVTGLAGRTVP